MNEEKRRLFNIITRNGDGESSNSLSNIRRRSNYVIFDEFFDAWKFIYKFTETEWSRVVPLDLIYGCLKSVNILAAYTSGQWHG